MSDRVIQTQNFTKYYGKARGVLDLDLEINKGEVFGFLGPNGAGKTTTIRMLMDFIRPTRGAASIFGMDIRRDSLEIRRRVGNLPGEMELYDHLTGAEVLRYIASLRKDVDWSYVEELAERLRTDLSKKSRAYSHGNKQKIGLIAAFMPKPDLLILDEPSSGLDPLMQQEFYKMIAEVKADGRTVFLSSHILPEVERTCDRVGIIREGRLVTIETVAEMKAKALRRIEIRFGSPVQREVFESVDGISDLVVENGTMRCSISGDMDALIKVAAQHKVIDFETRHATLENTFLTFYGTEANDVE